jgi:outer membrane protein, heavy metal efflux system
MRYILICTLALAAGGCVLAPKEAQQSKDALAQAGDAYITPRDVRSVPDLPPNPTWQDALSRALQASGDLEAAYFEWAMAVSKIDQAGSYPSQPIEIGAEYMFGGERMKAWDRTTVSAGLMDATAWPNKTYQSAKVAWRDAQAAGERFRAAKFKLQRDLLVAWNDYALQAERVRIQQENVDLLKLVSQTAAGRVRAGGMQQDLVRADLQLRLAEDQLASMQSMLAPPTRRWRASPSHRARSPRATRRCSNSASRITRHSPPFRTRSPAGRTCSNGRRWSTSPTST